MKSPPKPSPRTVPFPPETRRKLRCLSGCTFLPGSWDKRFVRQLSEAPDDYLLSPRQIETVDRLYHRYRRQITGRPVR